MMTGVLPQNRVALFRTGDERVFQGIYEQYAPALRFFAFKYLADKESVDDVVQDAFVALWEKRADFTVENAIKAYLYRVVQRTCLNVLRHQKAKERYVGAFQPEEDPSFLDNVLETEVFQAVRGVFEELTPACKAVYKMSLEGMSHEEISEKLQITVNTVKKHKNNANHYMRERLKHVLEMMVLFLP